MGMGQIHEKGVRGHESEEKTPSRIGIELRGNLVLGFQEKQQRGDAIEDHGPAVEMIGFIKALVSMDIDLEFQVHQEKGKHPEADGLEQVETGGERGEELPVASHEHPGKAIEPVEDQEIGMDFR